MWYLGISAITATAGITATFQGDKVMSIAMVVINVITLLSNAALSVYRTWRDRDKDLKAPEQESTDKDNRSDEGHG